MVTSASQISLADDEVIYLGFLDLAIIEHILGIATISSVDPLFDQADVNGDGENDIADLVALLNLI